MIELYFDINNTNYNLKQDVLNFIKSLNITYQICNDIQQANIENLFLFVEINEKDDILQYEKIKIKNPNYQFICISDIESLVFDSLCLYPIHFIRINHYLDDLNILKIRLQRMIKKRKSTIAFKTNKGYVSIDLNTIEYIESMDHKQIIHFLSSNIEIRAKTSQVLNDLNSYDFIQIHRSFIVNKEYIQIVKNNEIILKNNQSLPIGRKYKRNLNEFYQS